jgi:hypothetical protein
MFKRKQKTPVDAAGSAWHVFQGGGDEGQPIVARFNGALRDADRSTHPIQIGVAVPLQSPREDGLPNDEESAQLEAIEEHVEHHVAGRAVLVGVISTQGMREFVLYTSTGEWIEGFHRDLQAAVTTHEIQVMAQTDPKWKVYSSFVK